MIRAVRRTGRPRDPGYVAGVNEEYGRYLSAVAGCTSCHGPDLAGGPPSGPPGAPPVPNLTPSAIGDWTDADYFTAIRDGRRPDGTETSDFMPWRFAGRMSDDELNAIWLYLRSVSPR
jgi:cytochrome c553